MIKYDLGPLPLSISHALYINILLRVLLFITLFCFAFVATRADSEARPTLTVTLETDTTLAISPVLTT